MRTSKKDRREAQKEKVRNSLYGDGQYVFQNNTGGDLLLPKSTQSGRSRVRNNEEFIGDSYFFSMVKTNELRFIRSLAMEQEEKLIKEVPPTVTEEGTVEEIAEKKDESNKKQDDILLIEDPLEGLEILTD